MRNSIDNYIVLNVIKIRQLQNGYIFKGKIRFRELNQVFKLIQRKGSVADPFDNSILNLANEEREFQSHLSEKKLAEIQTYLKEEVQRIEWARPSGGFSFSVTLYCKSYEPDDLKYKESAFESDTIRTSRSDEIINEQVIINSYSPDLDCGFYLSDRAPNSYKLYIPKNPKTTLIVDGQHRFFATKFFYNSLEDRNAKSIVDNFEFDVTWLVGFDVYEVGQIFVTANINQKPANISLYYDIFGSAPLIDKEGMLQNDIRLAHDLTVHLNTSENSPINSMIKMPGKGYGLYSQAFFVEKMIRVFRTGIWNNFLIDYVNNGKEYKIIAKFMKAYFEAIHKAYPGSWPQKVSKGDLRVYSLNHYPYILCKTTGLGAFFRLIRYIYPKVAREPDNFKTNLLAIFNKLSDADSKVLFAKSGPYGESGSEWLQDKLFRQLLLKFGLN